MSKQEYISDILNSRIMLLDGAMATMIQKHKLQENDFRSQKFKKWRKPLMGMYDVLNITQPKIISNIHRSYLESGADIITTNTFSSNAFSLFEYGLEDYAYEINFKAAQIAKSIADSFSTETKPRFVAGSIGPTNRTYIEDGHSGFKEFENVFYMQAKALIEGSVDVILLETFYDMRSAKAAISAISKLRQELNYDFAVMVSTTIIKSKTIDNFNDIKLFYKELKSTEILSVGINCSYGANDISNYIKELSEISPLNISSHPNAGLPNSEGEYSETPDITAQSIKNLIKNNSVNIIGGCCGTTPLHIKEIAKIIEYIKPNHYKRESQS